LAVTRAAAGAGIGLLLADRLGKDKRKAVGWTLLAVGVISTIPIAIELINDAHGQGDGDEAAQME
jgi:hypothetical protein